MKYKTDNTYNALQTMQQKIEGIPHQTTILYTQCIKYNAKYNTEYKRQYNKYQTIQYKTTHTTQNAIQYKIQTIQYSTYRRIHPIPDNIIHRTHNTVKYTIQYKIQNATYKMQDTTQNAIHNKTETTIQQNTLHNTIKKHTIQYIQ